MIIGLRRKGSQGRSSGGGGLFLISYFFAQSSQSPSTVGTIQPKKITGSAKRKIMATVAGFTVPLGQVITKVFHLRTIATAIHTTPRTKKYMPSSQAALTSFRSNNRTSSPKLQT